MQPANHFLLRLSIHSFTHPFTHPSIHSPIHSLIHPFIHLLARACTHALTHSFVEGNLNDGLSRLLTEVSQGYFQPDVGGKNIPVSEGQLSDLAGDQPLFKALYQWCTNCPTPVHRLRWRVQAGLWAKGLYCGLRPSGGQAHSEGKSGPATKQVHGYQDGWEGKGADRGKESKEGGLSGVIRVQVTLWEGNAMRQEKRAFAKVLVCLEFLCMTSIMKGEDGPACTCKLCRRETGAEDVVRACACLESLKSSDTWRRLKGTDSHTHTHAYTQENTFNYDKGVLAEILEPIMGKGLIPADLDTWKLLHGKHCLVSIALWEDMHH
eukprot:scaffold11620_cov19-Tisochrysis_lutea.AAC.1